MGYYPRGKTESHLECPKLVLIILNLGCDLLPSSCFLWLRLVKASDQDLRCFRHPPAAAGNSWLKLRDGISWPPDNPDH